jgi:acyl-CoA dehydrogenase
MGSDPESDEAFAELRAQMRKFIEYAVIPAEADLNEGFEEPFGTAEYARADDLLHELQQQAKLAGIWALGHPKEIGGGGLSFMQMAFMNEIIGRSYYGMHATGSFTQQDSIMLNEYGTEAQREDFLFPLVAGEIEHSTGLTEPEVAGSDPTLMRTTATLDDGTWVIDGHKWFTSRATRAAFTSCFAMTDPDNLPHKRFSVFLVPTDTPGYRIVRAVPAMGHTIGQHCEVLYDNVRLPESALLGHRGEGFSLAQIRLGPGRIFHSMRWQGQAQRAFELMVRRAGERYSHGSLLADKGEIQRYVAESAAEIQAARLMTLDAARVLDSGADARVQISLVKVFGAQMLHNVIDRAIQVHGALGVTSDTPLERMYREARHARIYDGPDEVHRYSVAKRLLRDAEATPWQSV